MNELNRRTFLAATAGLPALTLPACCCGSDPLLTPGSRILVIGAGMAGIAAARDLTDAGYDVTVLEARDRTGGRIWSNDKLGVPVDLGASWIQGSSGNPLTALAAENRIRTKATSYERTVVYDHTGSRLSDTEAAQLAADGQELAAAMEAAAEASDRELSGKQVLNRALKGEKLSADDRRKIEFVMQTSVVLPSGAEPRELGTWYEDEGFGGEDRLFPGGYHQLVAVLAKGLTIETGVQVTQIRHGDGVVVKAGAKSWEADACVATVPLGVLQTRSITFKPALPVAKREAIKSLSMGLLDKVALRFPRRFWPDDADFVAQISTTAGEYPTMLNLSKFVGADALLAFAGGDFARKMAKLGTEQKVDRVLKVLRRLYDKVPTPTEVVATSWSGDRFAGGSYSHVPVGAGRVDMEALAAPVGTTLFFAGEATNADYPATVHGAYLSGKREAARIAGTLW